MRAALLGIIPEKLPRGRSTMLLARKRANAKLRKQWEQNQAADKFETGGPVPLLLAPSVIHSKK
jgi:hypothetical protein